MDLARMARAFGIESDARKGLEIPAADPALTDEEIADWIRTQVSPHPAAFAEIAEACQLIEAFRQKKEADALEGCGHPWGRVVRIFWRDRRGRERMRMVGLHSCKNRHCPRCGRQKQIKRTVLMEKILVLAAEWGLDERNVRFGTMTVENGDNIEELRAEAHGAWAKLERGRWWPRNVFGWFRGSECVTGKNGQWNFHMHIIAILWSPWISYSHIWDAWEKAVGRRARVDMETLRHYRRTARGSGLVRAARYATKYISKHEDLANLKAGPGGFSHYVRSMRRLRAFAMGGGASVLRKMAKVLMPDWAIRAEWTLQDEHLNYEGRAPWRYEEVDAETGEVIPLVRHSPFADKREREAWFTVARELYTTKGLIGYVGEPCGSRKRLRRIGSTPMPSKAPTIESFRAATRARVKAELEDGSQAPRAFTVIRWQGDKPIPVRVAVRVPKLGLVKKPLDGVRSLIAGGQWKVFHWNDEVIDKKTGIHRVLRRTCIQPAIRYSWRAIIPELWSELLGEKGPMGDKRRAAMQAWAREVVRPPEIESPGMIDPGAFTRIRWVNGKPMEDRVVLRTPAKSPCRTWTADRWQSQMHIDTIRAVLHGCDDSMTIGERHTTARREMAWKLQKEVWSLARSGEDYEKKQRLEGHILTLCRPNPVFAKPHMEIP